MNYQGSHKKFLNIIRELGKIFSKKYEKLISLKCRKIRNKF